jgi:hypothetical protein
LEPWEKVLVKGDAFTQSVHGKLECISCHSGILSADKDTAHSGLIARPSEDPWLACGSCHNEHAASFPKSLHATLGGYMTVLDARSSEEHKPVMEEMFGNHCAGCHTTCGDCHVSQPNYVGGGFLSGHLFEKTPPMTRTCTACHGSRVGNEYLGKNEDLPGDVHFRQHRMNCVSCHKGEDLHRAFRQPDEDSPAPHRYSGSQLPSCESCHVIDCCDRISNPMHQVHGQDFSCQVCHSIQYSSCDGCHVSISDRTGNPYYQSEATYLTFFIGRNHIKSPERPYDYVTVRHVPAHPDAYSYYGENLLPNFDSLPTWVYSTPHNIQLNTPQNASCEACHSNSELFLTADKVASFELKANQPVIVQDLPADLDWLGAKFLPLDHLGRKSSTCITCHKEDGNE